MSTSIADSKRLRFSRFDEDDVDALAELLADPSLTRNITSNGSTPQRCAANARRRIAWHNSNWRDQGYGVWALRALDASLAPPERLLGWCGFVTPDGDDTDPEILYAIDAEFRGRGIAMEAARHCISWLFDATDYRGVTAVISTRLNPGSVKVVSKLGLEYRGRMDFALFVSSQALADEVLDYEIWRLARDTSIDLVGLVQQAAYRAGQLSRETSFASERILQLLVESLLQRSVVDMTAHHQQQLRRSLEAEYLQGRDEAFMDCYHVSRERWSELTRA